MANLLQIKVEAIKQGDLKTLKRFKNDGTGFMDLDLLPALRSDAANRFEVIKFLIDECHVAPRGDIVLKFSKNAAETELLKRHLPKAG